MNKIIFLGLPGSGKGTQGKLLSKHLGIPHFSCGDCVRELTQTNTLLGLKIKQFLENNGECWQPLSHKLAYEVYLLAPQKCVLDGFPRNVNQLMWVSGNNTFVYLQIDKSESKKRVLARNRADDALAKWESRMSWEASRLPQLVEQCKPISIDAEGEKLDIFKGVKNALSI